MSATDFVAVDYIKFIPSIMLCVCYDKIGDYERAYSYHKLAKKCKPNHSAVIKNEAYFANALRITR